MLKPLQPPVTSAEDLPPDVCHTAQGSAEVRGRALESLEFKWKYGLIRSEDLLQVGIPGMAQQAETAVP